MSSIRLLMYINLGALRVGRLVPGLDNISQFGASVHAISFDSIPFLTTNKVTTFDNFLNIGKRKISWCYPWSEEIHGGILTRLLKLNQKRVKAEKLGCTPRRKVAATTPVTREHAPDYDDLPLFNNLEGTTK